jgi:hypothetical protein
VEKRKEAKKARGRDYKKLWENENEKYRECELRVLGFNKVKDPYHLTNYVG